MFNTASVAKTIIAETVLRLADRGAMSLDDSIAEFYRHPDLADDPRYRSLTPRIILSHQTGLLNWPYLYKNKKLAFVRDPGSGQISYSGAGIMILAHYLEERFHKSYPDLVDEVLFRPLDIKGISVNREGWMEGRVPSPVDADGKYHAPFTQSVNPDVPITKWSAADNLFATVRGYADFLTKLIRDDGLSAKMVAERQRVHSVSGEELGGFKCILPRGACPDPFGYGVGWFVFGEPNRTVLNHGGNDFGEHAQVYFARETGDGLVMFMNGSDFKAGLRIMETIEPEMGMVRHFRAVVDRIDAQKTK